MDREFTRYIDRDRLAKIRKQERLEKELRSRFFESTKFNPRRIDGFEKLPDEDRRPQNVTKYSPETVRGWYDRYKAGESLTQIARSAGCHPSTVSLRFKRLGLKSRKRKK
jgi:hypothetical protein